MKFSEFKWWLDGFSEHIVERPSLAEWERIAGMINMVEEPMYRTVFLPMSPPPEEYVSK